MLAHHQSSVENMTAYFRQNADVIALFLVGSVATATARADSDVDAVAVLTPEAYARKKASGDTLEVIYGHCTYQGGYFDIHYHSKDELISFAESGSEPMRNLFSCARPLFSHDPELPALVKKIPLFPKAEAAAKQLRFYSTFKQFYGYFWLACKPEGFMRVHVAAGMVYALYRLLLIENEMLFPSVRMLEKTVMAAPNKPEGIVEQCQQFLQTLCDDDCAALVAAYENWTRYDFPKEHSIVMNNFVDPWEWV